MSDAVVSSGDMKRAVVIEVALNGATPKSSNPHVPRRPDEIAHDALACIDAGASIAHNHNDEGLWTADGTHSAAPYAEAWRPILARHPGVLLYPTMASGGPGIAIEARWRHNAELARLGLCRVGLVDPGSVSLGFLGEDGLPLPLDLVYVNTHRDARHMLLQCAELGLAPSISIFDPSFLRVALAFAAAGRMPAGALLKLYFGGSLAFGLPPTRASLDAYLEMLEGSGLPWSVAVLGGDVVGCGLAQLALSRGGHLRVGLEDYAGPRTPTNVELVAEAVALATRCGRRAASIEETHRILGVPGSS
jgi:3-keto-5-aminohexanoate cleavage enzyme